MKRLHESPVCWNEGGILVEMFEQAESEEKFPAHFQFTIYEGAWVQ